jgi:hypothetical protein
MSLSNKKNVPNTPKTMINSITLSALRNAEFLQFSKDALSIVQLNDPAALSVAAPYATFKAVTDTIEDLFKTDRGNPITADLEALDLRRDNALTGITLFVQSQVYHFAPTTNAAANILTNHLAVFGVGIAKENYQSETAIITSITNDLATKPELVGAVAALGIASWVTELDTANAAFNAQYLARTQQLATVSPDTIKAKRLEAANAWYKLRAKLEAYYEINEGAQPFAKATNELNALIDQYNTLINGRKGSDKIDDTTNTVK